MKIFLVHEEYPEETNFGGIATYQKNIAEQFVKEGNEVYVICRALQEDKEYVENGVNIKRIYAPKTTNQINDYVFYLERVKNILIDYQSKNMIDIIEVPDWGAETVLFEPFRKVPLVVRLHTPLKIWLKYNKNNFGEITEQMLQWEEMMIKKADLITCCSSILKTMLIEEMNLKSNDIYVIPNPANPSGFSRNKMIKKQDSIIFVGSLEERKGVIVLAKALNYFFEHFPNIKVNFVGKDTTRNYKNISTIELIKMLVNYKYRKNLIFHKQVENSKVNNFFNQSRVAVFPSLFDNFPYVVLEAMLTGIHIVGSKNSGMTEMLTDNNSIYQTGDEKDLADKLIKKYSLSINEEICQNNIDRVKELYNPEKVCKSILKMYKAAINKYNQKVVLKNKMKKVLELVLKKEIEVYTFIKIDKGIANSVYKVETKYGIFIIKKYLYEYDFSLSDMLYNIYKENNIQCIRPLNTYIIKINNEKYNVFEFVENQKLDRKIDINYLAKFINCKRKVDKKTLLYDKVLNYYLKLKENTYDDFQLELCYLFYIYENLKENSILKESYLNHGDISINNILFNNNIIYLIDFDECTVGSFLYDFAVILIKFFSDNERIDMTKFKELMNLINVKEYKYEDYCAIIEFYLIKILFEKIYLHQIGKIDLFSKEQSKDNYKRYLTILRNFENEKTKN